jgi:ribosomal protein S18 acetylase RimI-like enzyme
MDFFMKRFLVLHLLFSVALYACDDNGIVDYVASRDRDAVIAMIQQDLHPIYFTKDEQAVAYVDGIETTSVLFFKVMRHAGKTVGFIEYGFMKRNVTRYHIDLLVVDRNFRRSGYASALMQFGIDAMAAAGADKIFLNVRVGNTGAYALYVDKFGFEEYECVQNKYLRLVLYIQNVSI